MSRGRTVRTLTSWWRRSGGDTRAPSSTPEPAPLVTVIVPVYDVEAYLAETVASLAAQTYPHLEVLLVDDASTDGSLPLARSLAEGDERFTVVEVEHGGLGATRNRGLERARGTYITFVDADDVLPPDALAAMVASLETSGSAFVTGGVERFDSIRSWVPGWVRSVHGRDRRATTLADLPEAMRDILACNRMYRRSFWDEHIGPFPEGMVYEDHVPMLRSYLGGTRFDVLAQVTYRWRRRDDGSSLSQPKDELANLVDRARAKADAWTLLEREGTATERALWLARVIDLDLVPYLTHGGDAAPEYQELLAATLTTYLEHATATPEGRRELAARVRGPQRLAAWYAAHRDWSALASLTAELAARRPPLARLDRTGADVPRAVVDDGARATVAPPLPAWWRAVPLDVAPTLVLTRITWDDDGLVVRGTLKVPGLALEPDDVRLSLVVDNVPDGHRATVLGASPRRAGTPVTGTDLDVVVYVPHRDLDIALPVPGETAVTATLDLASIVTLPVVLVAGRGTRAPRPRADVLGGTTILPVLTDDALLLRRRRAPVVVTSVDLDGDDVRFGLTTGTHADSARLDSVAFGTGEGCAALSRGTGTWAVARHVLADVPHDAPLESVLGGTAVRPVAPVGLRRALPRGLASSARGTLHVIPGARVRLTAVTAHDDGIRLDLEEAGLSDVPEGCVWHAVVRDGSDERPLGVTGDPTTVRLPVPRAGEVDGAQPTVASVRITLAAPDGTTVPVRVGEAVHDMQPSTAPAGTYDVRVLAKRDGVEMRVEHLEPR